MPPEVGSELYGLNSINFNVIVVDYFTLCHLKWDLNCMAINFNVIVVDYFTLCHLKWDLNCMD